MAAGAGPPVLSAVPTLFSSWFCPYAQRVLIAANYKKLAAPAFHRHEVSYDELFRGKPQWLVDLNPAGLVPFLAWRQPGSSSSSSSSSRSSGGTTSSSATGSDPSGSSSSSSSSSGQLPAVCSSAGVMSVRESLIINEFLEDRYPDPPLLPREPEGRAAARLLVQRVSDVFVPAFKGVLMQQHSSEAEQDAAAAELDEQLTWLCSHMCTTGPLALSDQLSLVDCALAPHLLRMYILRHYAGYRYRGSQRERLRAYIRAIQDHPAVQASMWVPGSQDGVALDYREELLRVYTRFAVSLVYKSHTPLW